MLQIIHANDSAYEVIHIIRSLRPSMTLEKEKKDQYKEMFKCNAVLKNKNEYLFCIKIEDANFEIIEEIIIEEPEIETTEVNSGEEINESNTEFADDGDRIQDISE